MPADCFKRLGTQSQSHLALLVVSLAMPSMRKCLISQVHLHHLNLQENGHKKGQTVKPSTIGPILIRLLNLGRTHQSLD